MSPTASIFGPTQNVLILRDKTPFRSKLIHQSMIPTYEYHHGIFSSFCKVFTLFIISGLNESQNLTSVQVTECTHVSRIVVPKHRKKNYYIKNLIIFGHTKPAKSS